MSIAEQLTRIEINRNTIRAKLVELGMATSTDRLDTLADAIANLVNRGAVSVTVKEGDTYTIPAGYHNGSGTVSGVAGGGSYNLQSKIATPTKKQQNVTPDDGYFGLSDVTIQPIPDAYQDVTSVTATAGDVLVGKIYVDAIGNVVAGKMPDNGAVSQSLDAAANSYTVPKGYHNGTGKVSITTESKSATPTKSQQKITPTSGKVLSDVTVAPIPDAYQNVSGVTAGAADVLSGKKIVSKTGAVIDGAIPVNGDVSTTIDGLNTTSCTIPAGHTTGGTVSLTDDIEDALEAIVGGENTGIKNELASLAESKADIAAAIESKGVTVPVGTKLDGMAALIGQIDAGGGEVKLETWHGTIMTSNTMAEVYYTDENGKDGYIFVSWREEIDAAKNTYIVVVTMDEQNPGPMFSNCELVWLLGNIMGGNYAYLVKITGDNFYIEG